MSPTDIYSCQTVNHFHNKQDITIWTVEVNIITVCLSNALMECLVNQQGSVWSHTHMYTLSHTHVQYSEAVEAKRGPLNRCPVWNNSYRSLIQHNGLHVSAESLSSVLKALRAHSLPPQCMRASCLIHSCNFGGSFGFNTMRETKTKQYHSMRHNLKVCYACLHCTTAVLWGWDVFWVKKIEHVSKAEFESKNKCGGICCGKAGWKMHDLFKILLKPA